VTKFDIARGAADGFMVFAVWKFGWGILSLIFTGQPFVALLAGAAFVATVLYFDWYWRESHEDEI